MKFLGDRVILRDPPKLICGCWNASIYMGVWFTARGAKRIVQRENSNVINLKQPHRMTPAGATTGLLTVAYASLVKQEIDGPARLREQEIPVENPIARLHVAR